MKTLYNTVQQYESILDPDQNKVMDRMKVDVIRQCIQEYCTYSRARHRRGKCWPIDDKNITITKIDKDEKGWYIDTKSRIGELMVDYDYIRSFYDYCIAKGCKIDKQKGFLIEDLDIYFRWHKHEGALVCESMRYLDSTDGMPEEIDVLCLSNCCHHNESFKVDNKIHTIWLENTDNIEIVGAGCENVAIDYMINAKTIKVPRGVKIQHPKDYKENEDLRKKILRY